MTRGGGLARVLPPPDGVGGVLLDVDDTLVGTRAAMVRAGRAAARVVWPDAAPWRVDRAGERYREDPEGHFRAFTRGEHAFEEMRARRVEDVARWLGQEPAGSDLDRWTPAFDRAFAEALHVFDDVVEVLETCRERGWRTALLTNSSAAYTRDKLELAGLTRAVAELTAGVVTKDTLGIGKPAPRVFHHGCRLMGLEPGQVVYVGDELDVDTCGALAAGLGAAWLRRPGYAREEGHLSHAASHGLHPAGTLTEVIDALAGTRTADHPGFGSGAVSG
ncbi:HAD family hydrolase [Ornithinimicrobium avium]|uniref:HAD family hydrolase n=1 Tax=Ornithinimicrobium avium TaxID=2283195 RepID=A0A345NII9_9MICO|nr:HAD family hydrolase [Ornithinimicrobium avium]AXH94847.1 HAD family hydrolase [Ornithinimicrobium avium]